MVERGSKQEVILLTSVSFELRIILFLPSARFNHLQPFLTSGRESSVKSVHVVPFPELKQGNNRLFFFLICGT